MARYAWLAMLALLLTSTTTYAADADEQAVSKIEHDWNEALKNQTREFFEKTLSGDFTFVSENGDFSDGRSAYIDGMMKMPKIIEYTVADTKIRVHGSTAVATGRWSGKQGTESSVVRYTDTFAKGTDGWKAIASQETKAK